MADLPLQLLAPLRREPAAARLASGPSFGRRIWDALEAFGARRAAREMRLHSHRWAKLDADAARLHAAAGEAAEVRQMADRYRHTDRGFAADLYAAADRHERLAEAGAAIAR